MPDVADVAVWNSAVSETKELADKFGAAFNLNRFPNGKERVVVELWFNPLLLKGEIDGNKNPRNPS